MRGVSRHRAGAAVRVWPAGGMLTLDEALEREAVVHTRAEFMAFLRREYAEWGPTEHNWSCVYYAHDDRPGRACDVWLVTINAAAAVFTDGPVPP